MATTLLSPTPTQSHAEAEGDLTATTSSMLPSSSRLGRCSVCALAPARYKCPACLVTSCSLTCVKRHKRDSRCSGVRDKTAFMPTSDFSDLDLLSDYRFLEEIGRTVDTIHREPHVHQHSKFRRHLPYWVNRLVKECHYRGIYLKIMPKSFARRANNSSQFSQPLKQILWHLEWVFPQAEAKYTDTRVSETLTLNRALQKYVNPEEATDAVKQKLTCYQSAGFEGISVLMKQMDGPSNARKLTKLDLSKSLCENFRNKMIVEYPTLVVVLKNHMQTYDINAEANDSDAESAPDELEIRHSVADAELESGECPISDTSDED